MRIRLITMSTLKEIDPRIQTEMSMGALDRSDAVPLYWRTQTMQRAPEEAAFAPMRDVEATMHYVKTGLGLTSQALPNLEDTRANRIGLMLADNSLKGGDLPHYYDPSLGRPRAIQTRAFGNPTSLGFALSYARKNKPGDKAFMQEVIRKQLANIDTNLGGLYSLVLEQKKGDGTPGIGWISEEERTRSVAAVRAIKNTKAAIQKIWLENEGEQGKFEEIWIGYETKCEEWAVKLEAKPAPKEAQPLGEADCERFLKDWGIRNTPRELLDFAHREEAALVSEIDRVQTACADVLADSTLPFSSNEEMLAYAREEASRFKAELVDSGVLPATAKEFDPSQIKFEFKSEAQMQAAFTANCSVDGKTITLHPFDGQESFWKVNGLRLKSILRHELLHAWQYLASDDDLKDWMNPFSRECGAIASKKVSLALSKDKATQEVLGGLIAARRQVQNFILSLEFHMGIEVDKETRISKIMETGLDRGDAERILAAFELDPYAWGMYWIGDRLFTDFVDERSGGDVVTGFQAYAHESQTHVPPHVLTDGFEPGNYEIKDSIPIMMRLAKKLVPVA